ncbi:MAG: phosphoglucosamine mutase [Pseudomonadota bacterium]
MRIFGTDGFRGPVNSGVITPDWFMRIGRVLGERAIAGGAGRVVIGRDTRRSGRMLEAAAAAGVASAGADAVLVGVLTTPAIGAATKSLNAFHGLAITASHNPYTDNGGKVFDSEGFKIDDVTQEEIETRLDQVEGQGVSANDVGKIIENRSAMLGYVDRLSQSIRSNLEGLKVVVDCANGAATEPAKAVFEGFHLDTVFIGNSPDGLNINRECGANHPETLRRKVLEVGADIGLAFDGDADRLRLVDEKGEELDGDQILGCLAEDLSSRAALKGNAVVGTSMTNLGLERALASQGIKLHRSDVGDRRVVEMMRAEGSNLGGEPSGHVILSDQATTGDGLLVGLSMLSRLVQRDGPASVVLKWFEASPQITLNVARGEGNALEREEVLQTIANVEAELGSNGRIVVRPSGTEPLIRVTVQAVSQTSADSAARRIAHAIEGGVS